MSDISNLSKAYQPTEVEHKWNRIWSRIHESKVPLDKSKETYSIVMPPPNVTGVLTMGHVLNNTLQDILIRRAKQQGKQVLWIPGTDHAGIATQTRVEKTLAQENLTRHDLGREAFVQKTIEWKDTHGGIIYKQLERLGISCDWDRSVYTLDADYSKSVLTSFVELYNRGYIYRGQRMIHWCPQSQTALSDEEIIITEVQGFLYRIRYELKQIPNTFIEVCTTRPETLMGDVAIAVNPTDPRFHKLIGQQCLHPISQILLPIIADDAVLIDFGTGALKITPAHDATDFEIGKRHQLPIVDTFNSNGTLNENAGSQYIGMDRFKARQKIVEQLEQSGNLVSKVAYVHNVGYSERSQVPVEPRLSYQWFLKYPKVEEAKQAVALGYIQFFPERWTKTYLHWLNNIQDWCISRQLWWGHRIPVWYRTGVDRSDSANWHVSLEAPLDSNNWEQDEDVLDTWFSSWLWPFATMGWPDPQTMQDLNFDQYYPTSDLVTGPDIIFFWVTRMIIAGLEFVGKPVKHLDAEAIKLRIPFKNVYFTGIIRDKLGRKMSKSLGNSPDPIDLIDLYGADGLRLGIIAIAPQGQDILFDEERIANGRNFCNKLWNACRFRLMSGSSYDKTQIESIANQIASSQLKDEDYMILMNLIEVTRSTEQYLNQYGFSTAVQAIYNFFWTDFCDWYLEICKTRLAETQEHSSGLAIQDLVLRQILLLLHPFIPFITEELWEAMGYIHTDQNLDTSSKSIQTVCPMSVDELSKLLHNACGPLDSNRAQQANNFRETISQIRRLKAQYQATTHKDLKFFHVSNTANQEYIQHIKDVFNKLAGAISIEAISELAEYPTVNTPLGNFYFIPRQTVDSTKEKGRLTKELEKLEGFIQTTQQRLQDSAFIESAPINVIEGAKQQLEKNRLKCTEIKALLDKLV